MILIFNLISAYFLYTLVTLEHHEILREEKNKQEIDVIYRILNNSEENKRI